MTTFRHIFNKRIINDNSSLLACPILQLFACDQMTSEYGHNGLNCLLFVTKQVDERNSNSGRVYYSRFVMFLL